MPSIPICHDGQQLVMKGGAVYSYQLSLTQGFFTYLAFLLCDSLLIYFGQKRCDLATNCLDAIMPVLSRVTFKYNLKFSPLQSYRRHRVLLSFAVVALSLAVLGIISLLGYTGWTMNTFGSGWSNEDTFFNATIGQDIEVTDPSVSFRAWAMARALRFEIRPKTDTGRSLSLSEVVQELTSQEESSR
jgi:hypothetical protein